MMQIFKASAELVSVRILGYQEFQNPNVDPILWV